MCQLRDAVLFTVDLYFTKSERKVVGACGLMFIDVDCSIKDGLLTGVQGQDITG